MRKLYYAAVFLMLSLTLQSCPENLEEDPIGYYEVKIINNSDEEIYLQDYLCSSDSSSLEFSRHFGKYSTSDLLDNWGTIEPATEKRYNMYPLSRLIAYPYHQFWIIKQSTLDKYGWGKIKDEYMVDTALCLTYPELRDRDFQIICNGESQWQQPK